MRQARRGRQDGPAPGGDGCEGVRIVKMNEVTDQSSVPCPPQEKALLHTFAAGQKYGGWRDATRRFGFWEFNEHREVSLNFSQVSQEKQAPS